jgi:hypothetical protein
MKSVVLIVGWLDMHNTSGGNISELGGKRD